MSDKKKQKARSLKVNTICVVLTRWDIAILLFYLYNVTKYFADLKKKKKKKVFRLSTELSSWG